MEVDVAKTLLTLKHDRECNIQVHFLPEGIAVDECQIDIKWIDEADWYLLAENQEILPWQANIAGVFDIRSAATFGDTTLYSSNVVVTNQFPSYDDVVSDGLVQTFTAVTWQNTLADCTLVPNQRREHGYWILLDTVNNVYTHTPVSYGSFVGPANGASVILDAKPPDIPIKPAPNAPGATYTVASFHTHTPTTYRQQGRPIGASQGDNNADNYDKVPGIIIDYIATPIGGIEIPAGHPLNSPYKFYLSLGYYQRPTP